MSAKYPYYLLKEENNIRMGFKYKTVPHITLKSLANNEEAEQEILYDQPAEDKKTVRVTGPFTVESLSPHRVSDAQEMISSERFVETVVSNLLKAGVQTGDRSALEALVARWHGTAFRVACCVCRNADWAEEAVQDAFLKLLTRKARFADRGPGSFRAWFLSLVTNCARMARRAEDRAARRRSVDPEAYCRRKGWDLNPQAVSGCGTWGTGLSQALNDLEERWRKPVKLHFLDGMPQKEMAAVLGVSQQSVSRRLERGLALLRLHLA